MSVINTGMGGRQKCLSCLGWTGSGMLSVEVNLLTSVNPMSLQNTSVLLFST